MNATQSALAQGLDLLTSTAANGESFRVHGDSVTFMASLSSQIVKDEGGRLMETSLLVRRSAFAALPADGAVIDRADNSESFRVTECRPASGGYINVIVRSAQP